MTVSDDAKFGAMAWRLELGFDLHGSRFGIRCDDETLRNAIESLIPYGWRPAAYETSPQKLSLVTAAGSVPGGLYFDTRGYEPVYQFESLDPDTLKGLETKLTFALSLACAPHLFFLHAGAVAFGDHGILIPGTTFSGKTTLVRELIGRGALYYTDDCVIADRAGRMFPNSIPLAVRGESEREYRTAGSLGAEDGTGPAAIGTVLFTRYVEGGIWQPAVSEPGQSGMLILKNLFYPGAMREFPAATMEFAARVSQEADAFTGDRGDASQVADWIERRLNL